MRNEAAGPRRPVVAQESPTWNRRYLLDLDELTSQEILLLLDTAEAMREVLSREVPRVPALRGVTVVNLFYEPSTRTRASFELAAKALGADVVNITAEQSSVKKGESLLDTVRTIEALGAKVLVLRHWQSGAPYLVARYTRMAVVNAGDGWHAHPTQALLDLYTMRRHLGELKGRKVVIVGDILHSRVARSNIWGLSALGAHVVLCGPPPFLPAGWRPNEGIGGSEGIDLPRVQIETGLDQALEGAEVVMALRLQRERMQGAMAPSMREYVRLYQIDERRLSRAKPGALVMHPGPVNEGIELAPAVARSAQSVIDEQVTNGVAVRMAVLYLLAGREE